MSNYPNPNRNQAHSLAHLSWGLVVFFYFVAWPLGLIFTILKLVDMKAEKDEELGRQNWINQMNGRTGPYTTSIYGNPTYRAWSGTAADPNAAAQQPGTPNPAQGQAQNAAQRAVQPNTPPTYTVPNRAAYTPPVHAPYNNQATLEQQKSLRFQKASIAVLSIVAIFALVSGIPELITGISYIGLGMLGTSSSFVLHTLLPGFIKTLGGIGMALFAARMNRARRQEKVLATIVGTRNQVSIRELTAASGFGSKKTLQLAQDAIQHGLFGPYSYIDMASETLVVRGSAPQPAKAKEAAPAKGENKYQLILRQLREANDRIPGEEMSAKISQLETLSARIFELAEKDPEKKPQLTKFMDYYLPTALKLLNTYATLDQQGMQGQNISETKASIENAMDLLVKAFEAQLDKLFQDDALDISGDVAALQSMMSMDGLTGTDFNAATPFDAKPAAPKDDAQ